MAPRTTGVGTAATPPALASFEPPELARERVVLSADAQAARTQAGGCSGSSERGEGTGGAGRCEMRQRRRCAPPAPAPFRAPAPRAQISTDAPTAATGRLELVLRPHTLCPRRQHPPHDGWAFDVKTLGDSRRRRRRAAGGGGGDKLLAATRVRGGEVRPPRGPLPAAHPHQRRRTAPSTAPAHLTPPSPAPTAAAAGR